MLQEGTRVITPEDGAGEITHIDGDVYWVTLDQPDEAQVANPYSEQDLTEE